MRKHKKRTVSFITLWDEMLTSLINRRRSYKGIIRQSDYYVDMVGYYSREDKVSYVYVIDGYPKILPYAYRDYLRSFCTDDVRITFLGHFEKYEIEWNSPRIKNRLRTWGILDRESEGKDEDVYTLYDNLIGVNNVVWKRKSIEYLVRANLEAGRETYKYRSVMVITGSRGEEFDRVIKSVEKAAGVSGLGLKMSRVIGDIPDYLKVYSPFTLGVDNRVLDACGYNVLPDEVIAGFQTSGQGTIGVSGLYCGTDVYSGFPVLKTVKQDGDNAEIWLVTGMTGSGKSYYTTGLLVQLLAQKNYTGTIMDIEGSEYLPLGKYMSHNDSVVVINMGEGVGAYYDPLEISVVGDDELDRDMYNIAISFTVSVIKVLLGDEVLTNAWVETVVNEAVTSVYMRAGVYADDSSTWGKSKGLTLGSVYQRLKDMYVGNKEGSIGVSRQGVSGENDISRMIAENEEVQEVLELMLAKLSVYFEEGGNREHLFRDRVSTERIKEAKLVICSFGMKGKSVDLVDPVQLALMQLLAAAVSYMRSIFSKHQGKYNIKVWEEFQRWGNFPDSDKTIMTALTGGRKLGDINIILTNDIGSLLKNDRFAILASVTTTMVGYLKDLQDREGLCERLGMMGYLEELNRIAEDNTDLKSFVDGDVHNKGGYKRYYKGFLVGLDGKRYTTVQMRLPKGLSKSALFYKGVKVKEEV